MIARIWHGWTSRENADGYEQFLRSEMFVDMGRIEGYRGVYLLRREDGDEIEFITMTLWDSLEVVRSFAGDDYERAVVRPEAQRLLSRYDERSRHYEVLVEP